VSEASEPWNAPMGVRTADAITTSWSPNDLAEKALFVARGLHDGFVTTFVWRACTNGQRWQLYEEGLTATSAEPFGARSSGEQQKRAFQSCRTGDVVGVGLCDSRGGEEETCARVVNA
jgi:hypothetical protein